jgi:hypothetical protein
MQSFRKGSEMSLTRNAVGAPKPRGMWMPQLRKPEYYALRDLTQVLKAGQVEVFAVLLRLGARLWDTPAGRQQLVEDLATYRTQAPSEANLPPISA